MGGLVANWTMLILMRAGFATQKNNYAHIIEEILGKRAGILLNWVFIIATFGVTTIYYITAANFFPAILTDFGVDHDFAHSDNVRMGVILGIGMRYFLCY